MTNTKQKKIDVNKDKVANENNFKIFRINIEMDIIDVILFIQKTFEINMEIFIKALFGGKNTGEMKKRLGVIIDH